jgi:competence ComEA-like helix-hairpin-helix protein
MTSEERKSLSFVALLLGLSVVARAVNRPDPMVISGATAVDISRRLEQNQQTRERLSKTTPKKAPAKPSPVPAWRRGTRPADVIEYKVRSTPAVGEQIVDVNRATAEQLDQLPGVSPAVAQRIVEYRTAKGPFQSFEQLDSVKGIGPALLAKLKPVVRFR